MLYGGMNFPVNPLIEEIKAISGMGFDYLELAMDPPQAHYTIISQQKESILKTLNEYRMGLVCHLPTFVYTADLTRSLREASLNEIIESLTVAAELKPLKVVLHPSLFFGLSVHVIEQAKQYALNSLEIIMEKADKLAICICLENMFPRSNSLVNPDDFIGIFEKFPEIKLTLDTGHANINSNGVGRTLDFIEKFHDRIGHIHANDNLGKEDNHLPVGTGTVNFPEIIRALKRAGYDETVTFEIFTRDRDYLKISRDKYAAMVESP